MTTKCEMRPCKGEPVQSVRRLWDDGVIHFCAEHAMDADADGLVQNRWGFPVSYRVESDARA